MAETVTKKRKFEGDSQASADEVTQMLLLWDQEQLRRVLAKVGAQSQLALEEIQAENNSDPKMRKIFVRNLPYVTTDASLRAVFEPYGVVAEAVVIMDKMKGQSKGFGFVTFETMEATNACLVESTKEIDGREAFINLAAKKDTSASTPASGGVGTAVSGEDVTLRKLFVRSLSYDTSSEDLSEYFKAFGEVSEAVVLTNRDTGTSKGYGFVTMSTSAFATSALQEPTKQLAGRTIYVKLAASNDGRPQSNSNNNNNFQQQQQQQFGGMNQWMGNMGALMGMGQMPAQTQQYGQQAAQYGQQAAQGQYGQQPQQQQQSAPQQQQQFGVQQW